MKRLSKIYVFTAFAVIAIAMTFQNCGQGFTSSQLDSTLPSGDVGGSSAGITLNEKDSDIRIGDIMTTDVGRSLSLDIGGRLTSAVKGNNSSDVAVFVSGLTPGLTYNTHVHNRPCGVGGGDHYKIDALNPTTAQNNELWITLVADTAGIAMGSVNVTNHRLRPEAVSYVIHAADGSRIACGDLVPERKATLTSGSFAVIAAGITSGKMIGGTGTIIRNANGIGQTVVQFTASGLVASTSYNAHVHDSPCAPPLNGGGHYKQNRAVIEAVASAANELWLPFTTGTIGTVFKQIAVPGHVARVTDAVSIVIHDPVVPADRIACVDLINDGGVLSTEVGLSRGRILSGKASIQRSPLSTTTVALTVAGLLPSTEYIPHVHDRPCSMGGGGHYKMDPASTGPIEPNEIWLKFTTDATGRGTIQREVSHIARPEAQAIVIHDPVDGARIGCVDLY